MKFSTHHSVLFTKSQLPKIIAEKTSDINKTRAEYEQTTGILTTEKQLIKKINNTKKYVELKSDLMTNVFRYQSKILGLQHIVAYLKPLFCSPSVLP